MAHHYHTHGPEGGHEHSHTHGHSHGIGAEHDYLKANVDFFDNEPVEEWPHAEAASVRTVEAIRETVNLDKDKTTLLEFGCGAGLVSEKLMPYVKQIVGVDISQRSVDAFTERFKKLSITPEQARAFKIELKGDENELDGQKFDIVISVAAFHHIQDLTGTTKILANLLKPDGALLICDMAPLEKPIDDANYNHIIAHKHGFSKTDMQELFESAGLKLESYEEIPKVTDEIHIFLAKAVKN